MTLKQNRSWFVVSFILISLFIFVPAWAQQNSQPEFAVAQSSLALASIPATLATASVTGENNPPPEPVILAKRQTPVQRFLSRWLDVQTATIGSKYRWIQNSNHVQTTSQMMQKDFYLGRVKLDGKGNYGVVLGAGTGNSFVGSWNTLGVGTGPLLTNRYLKQLYGSVKPVKGLELNYGSMGLARGQSTEITSYDNDGYVVGERLALKRPGELYFDEVSITYAYLGDLTTANVFKRLHRLDESNYHQFLVAKKFSRYISASADYTAVSGVDTVRNGIYVKVPKTRWADAVRFEQYKRGGTASAYGFAVSGEKKFNEKWNLTLGYMDIDMKYGKLNGNRFFSGKRGYATVNYTIRPELSFQVHANQAVGNSSLISNHTYLVYVVNYNVLKTFQKVGVLP